MFDPTRINRTLPPAFREKLRSAVEQPPEGADPFFATYCGAVAQERGLATYLRAKQQMLSLVGGVKGRDVLDAGSGFGVYANLLRAWGARRVYGIENCGPWVRTHGRLLRTHFADLDAVHPIHGDVSHLPLTENAVDLIISIEAISHYYDVPRFLDECARVLRPGGWLLISDGNNGANATIRAETEELWERLEVGPKGPCMSHEIKETMVDRRERIIRARFPQVGPEQAHKLAEATSGMVKAEVESAVATHLAGGPAPDSHYKRGTCTREPEWGHWIEWLFDPRELGRDIARRGFEVRLVPHYGGARNDVILAANTMLRQFPSFRFARAFRIAARKNA